jgi:hypothetical protein
VALRVDGVLAYLRPLDDPRLACLECFLRHNVVILPQK